jgi:hypothetical protein
VRREGAVGPQLALTRPVSLTVSIKCSSRVSGCPDTATRRSWWRAWTNNEAQGAPTCASASNGRARGAGHRPKAELHRGDFRPESSPPTKRGALSQGAEGAVARRGRCLFHDHRSSQGAGQPDRALAPGMRSEAESAATFARAARVCARPGCVSVRAHGAPPRASIAWRPSHAPMRSRILSLVVAPRCCAVFSPPRKTSSVGTPRIP